MTDTNNNGIPDNGEISFHLKSAIWGGVIALLVGGVSLTILGSIAPDNAAVKAVTKGFAGGVCDPVKDALYKCEKINVCYQAKHGITDCKDL